MMAAREWISTRVENHNVPSHWGVNTVRGLPSYDSYFESYNPNWRSHFSYWDLEEQPRYQPPPSPTHVTPQTLNSGMSLEDIVKSLALTTFQFQLQTEAGLQETRIELQEINDEFQETKASIQFLGNQISQLAMTIDKIAIQASQELTSQTDENPIEDVSAVTPQGGTELHIIEQVPMDTKEDKKTLEDTEAQDKKVESDLISVPSANICVLSFPCRMPKSKNDEKEILNTSLKVKLNTPVLELKTLPYHLQFLYLGVSETLSNIISQGLAKEQNELMLNEREVLRN
ncbi:UNVERIFIED_CONTAM: hypothetical protein Sradi_3814200 [Sesamum radiatum]|uniref:Uncharacterized protein n=1 Tax=Sesamum radiatum TaxID=300843 RepID=A0AAW2Q0V7_SESRA